jgi:hypothetical protein
MHKRPRLRRVLAWAFALLLVFVCYRTLVWVSLRMVDAKVLARELKEWAEPRLCTDVFFGEFDLNLNSRGDAKITLHDLQLENPSPECDGYCLEIDRIKAICPLWGLWGARCRPEFYIKRPRFTWRWGEFGEFNLDGLCDPVDGGMEKTAFPLGEIKADRFLLSLQDGEFVLERAETGQKAIFTFSCDADYDCAIGTFSCRAPDDREEGQSADQWPLAIVYTKNETALPPATLAVKKLLLGKNPQPHSFPLQVGELEASFSSLPYGVLRTALPELPPVAGLNTLQGEVEYSREKMSARFDAGADFSLPELDSRLGLRFEYAHDSSGFSLLVFAAGEKLASLSLPAGGGVLAIDAKVLNLSKFNFAQSGVWCLLGLLPAESLNLKCDAVDAAGVIFQQAEISAKLENRMPTEFGIKAVFAGGQYSAEGRLNEDGGLEKVEMRCENASLAAAKELNIFLPEKIRFKCESGSFALSVASGKPGADDDEEATPTTVVFDAKDVVLNPGKAGDVWRELAAIPLFMSQAEQLRRKAKGEPVAPETDKPLALPLKLDAVSIRYESLPEGEGRFAISGTGERLGTFMGGGKLHADGVIKLALTFKSAPQAVFAENKFISAEIRQAVAQQLSSPEGLRLDFTLAPGRFESDRRYVEDVFRKWTEMEAAKPRKEADK